jgi:hypothetical protein
MVEKKKRSFTKTFLPPMNPKNWGYGVTPAPTAKVGYMLLGHGLYGLDRLWTPAVQKGRIGMETNIEQKQRNGTKSSPRLSSSSSGLNPPLLQVWLLPQATAVSTSRPDPHRRQRGVTIWYQSKVPSSSFPPRKSHKKSSQYFLPDSIWVQLRLWRRWMKREQGWMRG